ncbi:MAG: DUF4157 domain-containing protein [Bacteroidota bacterium]
MPLSPSLGKSKLNTSFQREVQETKGASLASPNPLISPEEGAGQAKRLVEPGAQFYKDRTVVSPDAIQLCGDESSSGGKDSKTGADSKESMQAFSFERPSTMQRMEGGLKEEELEPTGQAKMAEGKTTNTIQKVENKTGMPDQVKSGLENISGMDLSDVKVHKNSSKPAEVGAHAFTQGRDIHVAPMQEKHIAHEGWHVVQQAQGRVKPTTSVNGMPVNDSPSLEKEADVMGERASKI